MERRNLAGKADLPHKLKRCPLFAALPADELSRLVAATRERIYVRGELVFQKGDRPGGLHLVVAGKLKEAIQSAAGDERIIEIIGPQQTCGEAAMLLGSPYPFFAAALVKTQMLHVDRQAILELIGRDGPFVERLMHSISARIVGVVRDIESCSLKSPLQRIAIYLLDCHASETGQIVLPAPKGVIAARLGMTPEALSRALRDLSDAGLIAVQGLHIRLIDRERLAGYCGD